MVCGGEVWLKGFWSGGESFRGRGKFEGVERELNLWGRRGEEGEEGGRRGELVNGKKNW